MRNETIISALGGFYDVLRTDNQIIRCRLRGRLRLAKNRILVGDFVRISLVSANEGIIEEILKRQQELTRPAIANVDQIVIVSSLTNPSVNLGLLDRLLILSEATGLSVVICFNKVELAEDLGEELKTSYSKLGYQVILTSTKQSVGIKELTQVLQDRISAFAGQSGVGKSSLLNCIQPGLNLEVGEISTKLKHGKHTTRMVRLVPLSIGGLIADTPGFSQLSLNELTESELPSLFPEFVELAEHCQFRGCLHHKEPNCQVKQALAEKQILAHRYQHYLTFLEEIRTAAKY